MSQKNVTYLKKKQKTAISKKKQVVYICTEKPLASVVHAEDLFKGGEKN